MLTPLERKMLEAKVFHVDGWTSRQGHETVDSLLRKGLITCRVSTSDQYTATTCTRTDAGAAALEQDDGERRQAAGLTQYGTWLG